MSKTKAKAPKVKQQHLPTMEPPSIPELDKAAEEYVTTRDERMRLSKEEGHLNDALLELLRKHDLPAYEWQNQIVSKETLEKAKVKKKKAPKGEADD